VGVHHRAGPKLWAVVGEKEGEEGSRKPKRAPGGRRDLGEDYFTASFERYFAKGAVPKKGAIMKRERAGDDARWELILISSPGMIGVQKSRGGGGGKRGAHEGPANGDVD